MKLALAVIALTDHAVSPPRKDRRPQLDRGCRRMRTMARTSRVPTRSPRSGWKNEKAQGISGGTGSVRRGVTLFWPFEGSEKAIKIFSTPVTFFFDRTIM
ncbi:hypothetical protein SAMN04488557_0326 [Hyphomicrobium facile]|uniref:Uncharacterized protein n=1 Tax=Hyphomicrobium facile TaxID=51670 RepID=A0A1I7MUM7_9HYPH|nr:hypothetical protein SAMN04488557_0326 [Hyphomicrobium facile]